MKLRTSEYFIQELFSSLKHNIWMTFASIITVLLSLFILGFFSIAVVNLNKLADTLESQVQVSIYLKDDVNQDEIDKTKEELIKLPGVENIRFISKEEALSDFKERLGDQQYLLESLEGTNPLPDAFMVSASSPSAVKNIAEKAEALEYVDTATFSQDIINHLFNLTHLIRIIGVALIILLTGAAIFIISNTIRLTIFARRKEIAIMKYVGATDWFIRWPFLLEGMFLGLMGGGIAAVLLRFVYQRITLEIYDAMAFFPLIPMYPFINYVTVAIICAGIVIGSIGSVISLKRFLKV